MGKEKLKIEMIKEFDESKPDQSAILTQNMADIINERKKKLIIGKGIFNVLSQYPFSVQSKNTKKRAMNYLHSIPTNVFEEEFKRNSKGKEIEIELIFFLAEDYEKRDLDNFIKPICDSLIGRWFEDDSQIGKIFAEKIKVNEKDIDRNLNPKLYEQIYVSARII
ncbi:MAG: RusA family crossover junction endodeoxyribonuclease [archaeon]|nr:RusA family crossover junction endodeoxyribonuclease [archaeon]